MSRDSDGDEFTGFAAEETVETQPEAKEPEAKEPDTPEGGDAAGKEPEANATDKADESDEGEKDADKGRSKPPSRRIAEITAARRLAERERDEALAELARLKGSTTEVDGEDPEPDPNDDKYRFGEADPQYLRDIARWEVRAETRAEREKAAKEVQERASEAEKARIEAVTSELNEKWAEKAQSGKAKYEDFEDKVVKTAAAKEWPLLPLSAAAVAASDVGDDVAYHLATNRADADRLAGIEREFHETRIALMESGLTPAAAMRVAKPHLDRATEFFEALEAKFKNKPQAKIATDAPEPAKHGVRGAGGKFTPDWSADDADLDALAKALK